MGLKQCDRGDCENIMCMRLSYTFNAYLCDDCFEELVKLGINADVQAFLNSGHRPVEDGMEDLARERFERIFKRI